MEPILVTTWGKEKTQIAPKYVSSGLAFETTPSTQLAPILFQVASQNYIYIIDANSDFLNVFDAKGNFEQQLPLPSILNKHSITSFEILNASSAVFLAMDEEQIDHLTYWNWQNNQTQQIKLGNYRATQLIFPSAQNKFYCWTEKEDYTGELWAFSTLNLTTTPTKNTQLPFISSKLFYWNNQFLGIKYFEELNKRGLHFVSLTTQQSKEIPCSDQLYGPLLYPIGINKAGALFVYGSPKTDDSLGTIYKISKEGILLKTLLLDELLKTEIDSHADLQLTPYSTWKILSNGTIILSLMTKQEVRILQLKNE